jgi:CRP-like cAMP-binding protein
MTAGDVVVREGDPADDVYVLLRGTARVSSGGSALRDLDAEDAFGEIGVVTGHPRTATVTAATDGELLRIPGAAFVDVLQAAPPLAQAVGGLVAARLSRSRTTVRATPVAKATT